MSKRQFSNEQFSTLLITSYLSECYCSRPVVVGFLQTSGHRKLFSWLLLSSCLFFWIWSTRAAPSTSTSSRFWFWVELQLLVVQLLVANFPLLDEASNGSTPLSSGEDSSLGSGVGSGDASG